MLVELYRPIAKATFYTETGELVAKTTNDPKSDIDQDIVSITTNRDLQSDSPTFSMELTNRKEWHKWVGSNDLVIIQVARPPEKHSTVFIGLVDDCRKSVAVGENVVSRTITVKGRGVAKALIRFDIGVVPEAEYSHTTTGWLVVAGVDLHAASPGDIAQSIWDIICTPHVNYEWSDGKTLFEHAGTKFSDRENLQILDTSTLMNWKGSIHSFLKDVAEEPFYEVFWEVEGDKDVLNVRPTPFNRREWEALPEFKITDEDVVGEDLGRSDMETYSIFSVGAKVLFSANDTYKTFGVVPYWNEEFAKKYGNSRLHVESAYTPSSDAATSGTGEFAGGAPVAMDDIDAGVVNTNGNGVVTTMRGLMVDLYNWNIMNSSMVNGTIVVKGSNKYKIGCRLIHDSIEDSSEMEYYITSVSHSLVNFGGSFITTLGVTRGMPVGKRFLLPWGTYTEYSGLGILDHDPVGSREALINGGGSFAGGGMGGGSGSINSNAANAVIQGARDTMNNGINGNRVRYVFGGDSPNTGALDCSSWTQYLYKKHANIDIGRVTGQQVLKGTKVEKSQLQPGDLVFFKGTYNSPHIYGVSHVGIYIGNGDMIHNSSSKAVHIASINDSYWGPKYLMGRRVLSESAPSTGSTGGGGNRVKFEATGYGATALNLMGGPGWVPTFKTATGTTPKEGRTIAVDRTVIPMYSLVRVECPTYPSVNGEYIAEDVGGAIKGNKIDIYFNDMPPMNPHETRKRLLAFGRREVFVTVLRRGK